ncbi:MAG: RNA polymerase sigma factor [bacterium]
MADTARGDIASDNQDAQVGRLLVAFKRIGPNLKRLLWSFHFSPEDAEDVLQKALLAAVAAIREGCEIENMEGWLFRTARFCCINHARTLRTCRSRDVSLEDSIVLELASMDSMERLIRNLATREDLAALLPKHRLVLELRAFGYTYKEIAEKTDYASESVRTILQRLRERLARQKGNSSWEAPPEILRRRRAGSW